MPEVVLLNPPSLTCHHQEFTSTGSANTETSKVSGSLETKYKWAEHGLTFTEKWNTDNTLGTEIILEDQVRSSGRLLEASSDEPPAPFLTCSLVFS